MKADTPTRIALLHLAPKAGEIEANKGAIERATRHAAKAGAKIVVTSELALSGYGFRDVIGTAWIAERQAELLRWASALARELGTFLLLGMPEAGPDEKLFNTLFVHGPDGRLLDQHRKIATLRVGSESWSSPGDRPTTVALDEIGRVGLCICADMYSQRLVRETAAQDIDILISPAAWAPGHHGPAGEWQWASNETQKPVLVCNRTGKDVLDFSEACSVAAVKGALAYAHSSASPTIVLADWSRQRQTIVDWTTIELPKDEP